jgi:hypothetical protein
MCLPLCVVLSAFFLLTSTIPDVRAQEGIVAPSPKVEILINDIDLNANPLGVDRYEDPDFVEFKTSRGEVGEANPEIVETGPNTGVFEFTIQLKTDEDACRTDSMGDPEFAATGGSDPTVGACPGDILLVQYEDERAADGRSALVDYVFEVRSSDPEIESEEDSYKAGDRVVVHIFDPDANRDPDVSDSLHDLHVFSDSDAVGRQFSAIETGRNTGTFELSFTTSTDPQGGSVFVRPGDFLTVEYADEFPADLAVFEEEKTFIFLIPITGLDGQGSLSLSTPVTKNANSEILDKLEVGQQAIVTMEAVSTFAFDQGPIILLFEIRDAEDLTVSLSWQTITLNAHGRVEAGMSWTPTEAGEYEMRAFLVNRLENPQSLSELKVSSVTVTGT